MDGHEVRYGRTGGRLRPHFSFDDTAVTSKLQLKELFWDICHQVSKDFVSVDRRRRGRWPAAHAFEDGSDFEDQAASWLDTGGAISYGAVLAANNASTITRDDANEIGSNDAVLIVNAGGHIKHEIDLAIRAIEKALNRDALRYTSPASFPTTGSVVV